MSEEKFKRIGVNIPKQLYELMKKEVDDKKYTDMADFVKTAIRDKLKV